MKKPLLLVIAVSGGLMFCQAPEKEPETAKAKQTTNREDVDIDKLFTQFTQLYHEFLTFKGKAGFKKYGFSIGGPYNKCLKEVQKFKDHNDSRLLIEKGVAFGELEQLGLQYVASRGEETEVAKNLNNIFKSAIASKPVE